MELKRAKEWRVIPEAIELFRDQPLEVGDKIWVQDFYKSNKAVNAVFKGGLFYITCIFEKNRKIAPDLVIKHFKVSKDHPRLKRLCRRALETRYAMQKVDGSNRCIVLPMSFFERGIAGRIGHVQK